MVAFYMVPGVSWGAAWLLFGAMSLLMFAVYFAQLPKHTRVRLLVAMALAVVVVGAATVLATDGFPVSCDTMPWWTLEYWWLCSK